MDGGLSPEHPAAEAPHTATSGRTSRLRAAPVLWAGVGILAVLAVAGWFLAFSWHGRANRAEDRYRDVAGMLTSSEGDVSALTLRQRDLSSEKARIEDDRAALTAEKSQLEANQQELQKALGIVQQIAIAYQTCSAGYVAVIRDLDASKATPQTQKNLDAANASCDAATRLIGQLPRS